MQNTPKLFIIGSKCCPLRSICTSLINGSKDAFTQSRQQYRTFFNMFSSRKDFGKYDVIKKPGNISSTLEIPSNIVVPEYYPHGRPTLQRVSFDLKKAGDIHGMKKSCQIARKVMNAIAKEIKVGTTTDHLDKVAHECALSHNSYPSPLHYKGYPKSICTSVNNVACHGIPDDRQLQEGDIISVDVTVYHNGYHGDCCETFCLPGTDEAGHNLVDVAKKARDEAIKLCGHGVDLNMIGQKCEEIADDAGFRIIPVFIGHGIGHCFHEMPEIYHVNNDAPGMMVKGMTFTIEPIVSQGGDEVVILEDGWSALTLDNARAAQFEHTILITDSGHQILTDYL